VNFFGHATVAAWVDPDPRLVFGAMLPDFASMSRTRLLGAGDPRVAEGIALHHQTDEAFHGAPTFLELYVSGTEDLEARGLGRGPARAVAHVGTELLLDGLLLDREPAKSAYLDAVALPGRADLDLRFRDQGGERFQSFYARLAEHGIPNEYRSPERVAIRLEQILSRRPRLAFGDVDGPHVVGFLETMQASLRDRLTTLLAEVESSLRSIDSLGAQRAILRERRI
jgi:hypothetical protein